MPPILRLVVLPLALLPAPALAQVNAEDLLVATCTSGKGCHCYLSGQSRGALATMLSTDPPEGIAHPVFVLADGDMGWSRITKEELDLTYGGDGLCDPEIFAATETGLPQDGTWLMTVTGHELSGCPKEVASAITGEVIVGQTSSRSITWPRPFTPAPLTADNPSMNRWVKRSNGSWTTQLVSESSDMGQHAQVTMEARVISPREIATTSVFSTNVLAVLTGESCVSTTHATLRLQG